MTVDTVLDCSTHLSGTGLADRTIQEYTKWLKRLARWCALHDLRPCELQGHHLREWAEATIPPGRESRKNARSACKHYYLWLGRTDQPWQAILVPRKRPGKPWPLTEPERQAMLAASELAGGRPGLAVAGMLQTAARPSEVARWRWDGVDLDARRLTMWRPKTRDWHTVPIRPLTLRLFELQPAFRDGHVFAGDQGRPHVTEQTVWAWCKQVAGLAGVPQVKPQRLRATALRRVLETSGQLDLAAELAGHLSTDTTRQYYAATSWDRLVEGVAALD